MSILKRWSVISVLFAVAVGLGLYWLYSAPSGVTPQGGTEDTVTTIAALAGAITTMAAAISGAAMKLVEYRKANLDLEAQRLANEKMRRDLEKG
jgi:hypothetical protein